MIRAIPSLLAVGCAVTFCGPIAPGLLATAALSTTHLAGPPIMCHPLDIGDAKSLPFGKDAFATARGYNAKRVVEETLGILKTADSPLVRMETLRRATVYLHEDRDAATELLAKLAWIALDADASGKTEWAATAWFDAGFAAACYDQMGVDLDWNPGVADGIRGYAWMRQALAMAPDDRKSAFEFAAALMTTPAMNPDAADEYRRHVYAAATGAEKDSLLEKNLATHLAHWGESLEKVRAEALASANGRGDGGN